MLLCAQLLEMQTSDDGELRRDQSTCKMHVTCYQTGPLRISNS